MYLRRTLIIGAFLLLSVMGCVESFADSAPLLTPVPPEVQAKGYVLMDALSGKILVSQHATDQMPPASLTKMMTSYVVSDALASGRIHLTDRVPISEKAWRTGGSKMFVQVHDQVPVSDLMQGIIVDSGNDASVAIAEYLAGSEESFVDLMNQYGKRLGMQYTHFVDANGLPSPQHQSTPLDMAILARALIFDFPHEYGWYAQKKFTYNHITQTNRNLLLWRDASVDGLKTGHTDEAGYCLVASAYRDGMRLISVVMGAPSAAVRSEDTEQLLNYGFRFFETRKMATANQPIAKARVFLGAQSYLPVGVTRNLYVTVPKGTQALKLRILMDNMLKAPIARGDAVGWLIVTDAAQKVVAQVHLEALSYDPKGGWFRRMADYISLGFNHLFKR